MTMPDTRSGLTATTNHTAEIGGQTVEYTAQVDTIPLLDDKGDTVADMFVVAYTLPSLDGRPRPLTFLFNGGPGSSSVWLHMGGFGPLKVLVAEPGNTTSAPYPLVTNEACLLALTDLVFMDAIGTGFSRVREGTGESSYFGIDEDAAAFTQAIRRYVRTHARSNDPKFLLGESYGAMRAIIVANALHQSGLDLNGLILLSGILSFAHFAPQLDQQAIDLFPSYAATAWHHGRITIKGECLETFLGEVRRFARGPYAHALSQGQNIGFEERTVVAAELQRLTGISQEWWISANLRAGIDAFRRELLRHTRKSLGASDTRYVAAEIDGISAAPTIDASHTSVSGPYQCAFEAYIEKLGCKPQSDYIASDFERISGQWNWAHKPVVGPRQNALASVVQDLSHAMRTNPGLKVLVLCGYFDLMTPFFGTEYDLGKLFLPEEALNQLQIRHYSAGHMLYATDEVRKPLYRDIAAFYLDCLHY